MYYDLKKSGLRVQQLRMKRGITQEQLAAKLNTSMSMISKVEQGTKGVSIDFLIELATFFNVSTDYLLLGCSNDDRVCSLYLDELYTEIDEIENHIQKTKVIYEKMVKNAHH